jgi:hypothetical protein
MDSLPAESQVAGTQPLVATAAALPRGRGGWLVLLLLWATVAYAGARMLALFRLSVDVPYWDQWNFVDFLRVTDDGASWSELWAPHNEHRVVIPKVVLLALARLTHWNVRAEIALVHALIIARFVGVFATVYVIGRKAKLSVWTCVPVLAAFLLTRGQAENLMWGWQVTLTLGIVFTLLTCLSLSNSGWPRYLLAIVFALATQFSFASGVVLWPIGAAFVLIQPDLSRGVRLVRASVWLAIGAVATYLYNEGLPRSPDVFPVTASGVLRYALTFLGSPLAPLRDPPLVPSETFAWRAGVIGIALFAVAIVGVLATKQFHRWTPIIMWGLTAPATAAVTALGRVGFVPNSQALASRYISMSVTMWSATAVLLTATVLHLLRNRSLKPSFRSVRFAGVVVTSVVALTVVTIAEPWEGYARRRSSFSFRDRSFLADEAQLTPEHKGWMYPDPALIDRQRPYLIDKKLTVFRKRQPATTTTTLPSTTTPPTTTPPTTTPPRTTPSPPTTLPFS